MTYDEAVEYLYSLVNYERMLNFPTQRVWKLDRMVNLLECLGHPQQGLRVAHIAGSKGKGSTAAITAHLAEAMGWRVGLYTSPHLSSFRERIRVLDGQAPETDSPDGFRGAISHEAFAEAMEQVKPVVDTMVRKGTWGDVSFFEVCTALAWVYFQACGVDLVVMEVGLGGRCDATNVVEPAVCAITPVSLEHTHILGDSLDRIAREKAGIIKRGVPVVLAPQEASARTAIIERCHEVDAPVMEVGVDVVVEPGQVVSDGQSGALRVGEQLFDALHMRMWGMHQWDNAATALGIMHQLVEHDAMNVEHVRQGLHAVEWPGRCEWLAGSPSVLLDGAHNEASAQALTRALQARVSAETPIAVVLGVSCDKQPEQVLTALLPLSPHVVLTQARHPRAMPAEEIANRVQCLIPNVHVEDESHAAVANAVAAVGEHGVVVVTGSLFLVGEVRERLMAAEVPA